MSQTIKNSYVPLIEQLPVVDFTEIDYKLKIMGEAVMVDPTRVARREFYLLLLEKAWLVHGRVILVNLVNKWSITSEPLLDDSFEQLKVPPQKLISEIWRAFGQEGGALYLANIARKKWTVRQMVNLLNLMHQPNYDRREREIEIAKLNQEIG